MAWLINQNSTSLRFLPNIVPTPDCPDHRVTTSYRKEYGFHPSGIHSDGNFIEDRFWPVSGQFKDDIEIVPRLLGVCGFYLVPETWYEVISELEPGVHQFKHVPLFLRDGTPLGERFYALNIRHALIDVADKKRSTAPYKIYGNGVRKFQNTSESHNAKVYFTKQKLRGFHLWQPIEILIYRVAMSDQLFRRISGLGGIETIQALEVEEV